MKNRCQWAGSDPLYIDYHDLEWGFPLHSERRLFEMLVLEGAQAGLSWITILRKRDNYRKAFDGFDAEKMARYGGREIQALMANRGIVRNRLKIEAAVRNARAFLKVREARGSFDAFIWDFVDGVPIQNQWSSLQELPAHTPESQAMSKELRRLGFKFVGPTICYAYMQAVGMVNDHVVDCFRHAECRAAGV